MLALAVYFFVCIYAPTIEGPAQFMLMGVIVATSQGGAQALSRSIFASIVPKTKSSEFFGFFSVSAKFAGIFGPLTFGVVSGAMGSSRPAILSLIVFVVVGMLLLACVNVDEGRRVAEEEDAEMRVVEKKAPL
jgi:UMF1 family MFS transporter